MSNNYSSEKTLKQSYSSENPRSQYKTESKNYLKSSIYFNAARDYQNHQTNSYSQFQQKEEMYQTTIHQLSQRINQLEKNLQENQPFCARCARCGKPLSSNSSSNFCEKCISFVREYKKAA